MSPELRLRRVLDRLASLTSITRTRAEEAEQAALHGDERKLEKLLRKLEAVADELEAALR